MSDPRDDLARLQTVLIDHCRRDAGSCLCGWSELGRSHARHQAEQILAHWQLVDRT